MKFEIQALAWVDVNKCAVIKPGNGIQHIFVTVYPPAIRYLTRKTDNIINY